MGVLFAPVNAGGDQVADAWGREVGLRVVEVDDLDGDGFFVAEGWDGVLGQVVEALGEDG